MESVEQERNAEKQVLHSGACVERQEKGRVWKLERVSEERAAVCPGLCVAEWPLTRSLGSLRFPFSPSPR